MLGPTGLKKKKRKRAGSGGHSFAIVCAYIFVVLVSGVVYSGIELRDPNQKILKQIRFYPDLHRTSL